MSTKNLRTVADHVRFEGGLRIECGSCGNAKTVDGFALARSLGTGDLHETSRRLVCFQCGVKDARLTLLPPMPER